MKYTSIIPSYVPSYGLGRLLVHGGEQISEGTEDVGLDDVDFGTGRSKHTGVRELFQGSGTDGSYICVGDVGDNPPHEMVPGRVPA